jgi:hypothetical protein
MDAETVSAKFDEQLQGAKASAMAPVFAWEFSLEGLVLYVKLRPRRRSELTYLLRVGFDDFPRRPPSFTFVNQVSKHPDDAAWPPGVRHGAQPPGICTPGTREFHENYHGGDGQYPWDSARYPLLVPLHEIHRMMERGIGA